MTSTPVNIFLGLIGFFLAGLLGYWLFPSADTGSETSAPIVQAAVEAKPVTDPKPSEPDRPSEPAPAIETTETPTAPPTTSQKPLSYLGWETVEADNAPQACLLFSESFNRANETDLKPFIRVTPETPFSIKAEGRKICVLGLAYGQTYRVVSRKGLTADAGAELPGSRAANVTFQDKPAFVGFAGTGIILPETQDARLVLKTVNVERVDLKIYRVNDRILSQYSPDQGENGVEGRYVSTYIASDKRVEIAAETLEIDSAKNAMVETTFDLAGIISAQGPGAYIVMAENAGGDLSDYRNAKALRWIISTDLALTSYRGASGLDVSVRSIKTAGLQAGVRLDLVARNNEQLAETLTDSQGRARFEAPLLAGQGPLTPKMIMAYGPDGDYAVLDLARAPLDLTAMDVQGRDVGLGLDIFNFTDRGIYRPGETVHLTALLRDADARAVTGRTLVVELLRPDGKRQDTRRLAPEDMAGGYVTALDLPDTAARGRWTISMTVEGTEVETSTKISVEDFVPQKLKLTLSPEEPAILRDGGTSEITLDAQFYYGAPGSALDTEAKARVQRDPNPFPHHKGYSFGDVAETFQEQVFDLEISLTDEEGSAKTRLSLAGRTIDSQTPLRASVVLGVAEPGGRYVRDGLFVPIRTEDQYIGFNTRFDGRAKRNAPANIDLIAVDAGGARIASAVDWSLFRESYGYNWYRENDRWVYRGRKRDQYVDSGRIAISADAPARWGKSLDYGRYRLETVDADGTIASVRFGVGWYNTGETDAPDRILVGATDLPETPGGSFLLNLEAPYAGQGDIVIADHKVRSLRTISIPEGVSSVRIPYEAEWGHSIYAMVTLYTPLDADKKQSAKRAVGLTHIALGRSSQTIDVSLNTPDRVAPRETIEVPITLSGAVNGKAYLTLAAVDEGILALTKFRSPDAAETLFAKMAFALDVQDDYARILEPWSATTTRSGGDSLGGAGLSVVPTQTVALFRGPVTVRNGKAVVPLDLPDFNGELRLMATAWTKNAVGSASKPLKVRDAVPATLALPRFLAPGDRAVATLSLDNIDGTPGTYRSRVSAAGLLDATDATFDLPVGTRDQSSVEILAEGVGVYEVETEISGPRDYGVTSVNPIEVRSPFRPVSRRFLTPIEPGESYRLPDEMFEGYARNSASIDVGVSPLPGLNPAAYVNALSRYPYGCTEQTVSSAMPLLYVEQLGGFKDSSDVQTRTGISKAILKLGSRQSPSGAFGLWSEGDGALAPWLQLYVTEFLVEADRRDFDVPEDILTTAMDAAKSLSDMNRNSGLGLDFDLGDASRNRQELRRAERAAYAHHILVRAGQPDASGARYVHDTFGARMTNPLAQAYLGAALSQIGDADRAEVAFERAMSELGSDRKHEYYFYSSRNRNVAGVLAIGGEAIPGETSAALLKELADRDPARMSTQERSYIVRAIAGILASSDKANFRMKGADFTGALSPKQIGDGVEITNNDDRRLFVSVDIEASPMKALPAMEEGFTVSKSLFTLKGKPITGDRLQQGDQVIVLIDAEADDRRDKMVVINDMLPAGLEIETVLTPEDAKTRNGDAGIYDFLGTLSYVDLQEARDDRFVASDRIRRWYRSDRDIRVAYIARAVTPGSFTFPGTIVEDMYRPDVVGTTEASELLITSSGAL
jgi:uncharacterized protein YfaS (alpha-2-macroglobulin family)